MHQVLLVALGMGAIEMGEQFLDRLTESSKESRASNALRDHVKIVWMACCFLASYALFFQDILHAVSFGVLSNLCYMRQFGTRHEIMHLRGTAVARPSSLMFWLCRLSTIPSSPLHMCQDDVDDTHVGHHKAHHPKRKGAVFDPDGYMIESPWLLSAVYCFFEAELGTLRYLHRTNYKTIVRTLSWTAYKTLVFFGLWKCAGGWDYFSPFLISMRVANFLSMFLFHKVLHHGIAYTEGIPAFLNMPAVLVRVILGQDILTNVLKHELHHTHADIHVRFLLTSRGAL